MNNQIGRQPFSITLFATNGDPGGIRHVDKSNWSGFGVVFKREHVPFLRNEPGFNQAGVYILVGTAAEETIYIGEADPVGDRLKNHVANKADWSWGVYFFDKNSKIGKTEIQYLEAALIKMALEIDRASLTNKNKPTEPSISPMAKATAEAFLQDMLLILPMLGIQAFTPGEDSPADEIIQASGETDNRFDTVVVPAKLDGFQQTFLGQNCWYAIRINAKHIPKLKWIAAYQVAPESAITHIAEVSSIDPYGTTGKYIVKFKGHAVTVGPIPRPDESSVSMQSPRYALKEKLVKAKTLDEVWE